MATSFCQAVPGGNHGQAGDVSEGDVGGEPLGDFYSFPTVGQLGAGRGRYYSPRNITLFNS